MALIITLFLDNTVPGTREERGLHVWQHLDMDGKDWWDDDYANQVLLLSSHAMCGSGHS